MSKVNTFSWDLRDQFVSVLLAAGGSGNVSGESSGPIHLGRYGRQYSREIADMPGRIATFHCQVPSGEYVMLTSVPWAGSADYDEAYETLIRAGATPNDLTIGEREQAHAARANYRSMDQVAEIERQEVRDGAGYCDTESESDHAKDMK